MGMAEAETVMNCEVNRWFKFEMIIGFALLFHCRDIRSTSDSEVQRADRSPTVYDRCGSQ
jgi:hypothetical protein